jgi:cell division protein FtsQ
MPPLLERVRRAGADAGSLTRKRFARRQWARRWLVWRLVVAGLVLLGLAAAGVWTVFFSSVLSVDGVDVTGTRLLTEEQVRAAAAVPTGEPLARADLDAITARVESLAPVASVDVSRKWPDQVMIAVTERVAVAVVRVDDRLRGMDSEGRLFRDFPRQPKGLPVVEVAPDTREEAMAEAAHVVAVLPRGLARRLDHVDVSTVDHIVLALRDGREVLWGSAEQSTQKADVLAALLDTEKDGKVYDVSVPGQPTVR